MKISWVWVDFVDILIWKETYGLLKSLVVVVSIFFPSNFDNYQRLHFDIRKTRVGQVDETGGNISQVRKLR